VVNRRRAADAEAMFESGIGPGVRSDRFGTWSLISFLLLFVPVFGYFTVPGLAFLAWVPALACITTTLAALGCGLVGVFSRVREQRRAALHGLLKAAVPAVVGGTVFLFILALSSMNIE
jgi:hypothetical protein